MKNVALSFEKILNNTYTYEIGKKNRKIVLSINIDSSNFFHLTGLHHISHLKFRSQVFYNRCLKGEYQKLNLLNYFSEDNTSFFSDREYHEFRIEVVERIDELLTKPNDFVFKKVNKQSYFPTGSGIKFSYCIENEMISSNGTNFKAILYFKFVELENNIEKLKIQSIGIQQPDYQVQQLARWKILNQKVTSL